MMTKSILNVAACLLIILNCNRASGQEPVRIGIAGLSHSHVISLLRDIDRSDIKVVGIFETDTALANRYVRQFGLDKRIVFESLENMLDKTRPEGVVTYTSIFDHLKVVRACAPRGIHVMVEKPLAVSMVHAGKMSRLADRYGILLLTNYETTWYPSNHVACNMLESGTLGDLRKVIVYDGHSGPREINVNTEFLEWLTDPELNGGGAVTDFGCYGADLVTWLMKGRKPEKVTAILKTYKPDIYPEVDDDATIILSYPEAEGIIHASWNWPFNRKDMHIYGTKGYVLSDDMYNIRCRTAGEKEESHRQLTADSSLFIDPLAYFSNAVRGMITVKDTDLSSLPINVTVVSILDAAKRSSKSGRQVKVR